MQIKLLALVTLMAFACSGEQEHEEYYENGSIKARYGRKNGQLEGMYYLYHKSGNLAFSGEYLKGQRVGEHFHYYDNDLQLQRNFAFFEVINGIEKKIKIMAFDSTEANLAYFEYDRTDQKVGIEPIPPIHIERGDSVGISLSFANALSFYSTEFRIKPIKQEISDDNFEINHVMGDPYKVSIPLEAVMPVGEYQLSGTLFSFDIKTPGDSLYVGVKGTEKGIFQYYTIEFEILE